MSYQCVSTVSQVTPGNGTSAYAAGQCVGGLIKFSRLFAGGKGCGVLADLFVKELGSQKAPLTVIIFGSKPAGTFTDGAAPTISAADWALVVGTVSIATGDYTAVDTTHSIAAKTPSIVVRGDAQDAFSGGAADLYAVAITSGTPTFTSATAIQVGVGVLLDS